MGDRKEAGGRRRPADDLLRAGGELLAASGEGSDNPGQWHLQRLAHGRGLARQIAGGAHTRALHSDYAMIALAADAGPIPQAFGTGSSALGGNSGERLRQRRRMMTPRLRLLA